MGRRQLARRLGELCLITGNEEKRMADAGELLSERPPDPLGCPGYDDGRSEWLDLFVDLVHPQSRPLRHALSAPAML